MSENSQGSCPFLLVQKVLSGKWSLLILYYLSQQTFRFNELQRLLNGLTQSTLSTQLKHLETSGLIERHVYSQIPPKVEYSLSPIGKDLIPVINSLSQWGQSYIQYMAEHK